MLIDWPPTAFRRELRTFTGANRRKAEIMGVRNKVRLPIEGVAIPSRGKGVPRPDGPNSHEGNFLKT